jgi:glyoxylase-like metal-dependent hydrolase (beta-lactamase superfamily II)
METSPIPAHLTPLSELAAARAETNPGARLRALRRAAAAMRDRIGESGTCLSVRTEAVATFPYPARYGLSGAALSPAPYVMIRNAMQLVQVEAGGDVINILVNPSDPERSLAAPFFARQLERYGETLTRRVLATVHGDLLRWLSELGVRPADIDYVTFDHLHVQDLRGLLGTETPEPGADAPTEALLPNARLLVQRAELRTLEELHPLQFEWYVPGALAGVRADKIVALEGDYLIGGGFAIVSTPGHTEGNHTLVVNTDSGLWTISENGICVEAYAPEHSRIPGVRRHARERELEVILNGNTRENSLDQYSSMVLEKTLADPCRERPEFPQVFPSSEMVRSVLAPGLAPTYRHDHITHGEVALSRDARAAAS